jgi:predicted DNA-binding transcriptional regulator AlpA
MRKSEAVPSGNEEAVVRGKLISISKAVEMTGLGKDFFYTCMKNGTLPFAWFMLTPGKRLIDSADIKDWIKLRKIPAGSMPGDKKEAV